MKKKIFSLILCLTMCVSVLAGCNLFGTDLEHYYNTTVATINYSYSIGGEQTSYAENITKRELINAYNSYGYNYVQSYNYTMEEAIDMTIDTIVNRKLMITAVKKYYQDNGLELLNDAEKTYIWEQIYESLYDNLRNYYNDIMGIEDGDSSSSDSTDDSAVVYEKYEKNAVLYSYLDQNNNQRYGVKKITPASTIRETGEVKYLNGVAYDYEYQDKETGKYIFQDLIKDIFKGYTENDTNWKSAYNQYLNTVRDNYSYEDFENDDECFLFEMNRVYEVVRDNYIVDKYEEIYNKTAENGSTLTNVRTENVLSYYENQVRADYEKYYNNASAFETAVLDESTNVNYVYRGSNATNYFNVGVIKIDFKGKTVEELKAERDAGKMTEAEYQKQLDNLYKSMYVNVKDSETGETISTTVGTQTLLDMINKKMDSTPNYLDYNEIIADTEQTNKILEDLGYSTTIQDNEKQNIIRQYVEDRNKEIAYQKADAFIEYYYYYNDDTTYLNKDKTAVFGVTSSGEAVYSTTYADSKNDAFDEALIELYNNGNAQVGDTSSLIRTDDGIYILFYAGEVESVFSGITENFTLTLNDIIKLASTRVNIFSEKTIFDQIYDTLYVDNNFDNFEEENLKYLKQTLTTADSNAIIKNYDEYKDLF